MLNEKSKEQLRKAGWYEGRKINIDHIVECCESEGFPVFDAARKVLEEFGDLIVSEAKSNLDHNLEICEMYDEEYIGGMSFYLSKILEEGVLEIASIYSGQFYMYISESGKIYCDDGIIAEDIYTAWNVILETIPEVERRKSWRLWSDIGIDIHKYLASRIGGRGFHDL